VLFHNRVVLDFYKAARLKTGLYVGRRFADIDVYFMQGAYDDYAESVRVFALVDFDDSVGDGRAN
jgi:hypothetical protein